MKKITGCFALMIISSLAVSPAIFADPHDTPKIKTSEALEKMKQLAGTWTGTGKDMGDAGIEVNYRVSSGGSSVVETLFPGTANEMTTVYYDEAGKLSMTHYCSVGNHPVMHLKKSTDKELHFEANSKGPLHDKPHMTNLDLTLVAPNSIEQKWSMLQPGKESHSSVLKLERKS